MKQCYRVYNLANRLCLGVFWLTDRQITYFSMKEYRFEHITSDRELNMFSHYKDKVLEL